MSRRASLLAKQEKRKPRVRFPDELVFLDNIKGNDIQACHSMLRRASVQLDINGLDSNGLTPLHNAVLEGNLDAVKLLVQHGAEINRKDTDTWTPLHAACANSECDIARFLLSKGASKDIKTADGERPLDLCDARDFSIISVMLESDTARRARMLSAPDEELEDDDDCDRPPPKGDNKNDYSDNEGNRSSNPGSCSDSSPEPPRRSILRKNDQKKADSDPKSTSAPSSLVKAMSSLKTVQQNSSSKSTLSVSPSRKGGSPSSTTRKSPTAHLNVESSSRPPKPPGHSILKKSPQPFKTVTE